MAETLPVGLTYQDSALKLIRSVSMSRYGQRAVSFIENGDPYWQWTCRVTALFPAQRQKLEAFIDRCRGGQVTVHYTPKHVCIPQAYWGDPNNPAIIGNPTLTAINGNTITLGTVVVGLKLKAGDLIGLSNGDYNLIVRVAADATAVTTNLQVQIEPFLPSYITTGSVVRLKNPIMNMRLVPNSFDIGDGFFPEATFQLVEVPK